MRKQMWWKDMKMKLILGGVIAAILIIIIGMLGKRLECYLAGYGTNFFIIIV